MTYKEVKMWIGFVAFFGVLGLAMFVHYGQPLLLEWLNFTADQWRTAYTHLVAMFWGIAIGMWSWLE